MRYSPLCALLVLVWLGCGSGGPAADPLETRIVTLPNGTRIRAEVKIRPLDLQRGMMFRDALPPGEGMLFIHPEPGAYSYWMYNVQIPLDIIWMDSNRRIVEIASDVPPCRTKPGECPNYGGNARSQYVLELGGGEAARHGLRVGHVLQF